MAFIYTRSQLIARINAGIQGRKGILVDINETANDAVREVINQIDISSTLRSYSLAPKLFRSVYDYAAPSDLKSNNITDIPPQVKRSDGQWFLVSPEEFDRSKGYQKGQIALDQYNGVSILRIATNLDDQKITISSLDSLTAGGGTWIALGDFGSLTVDNDDFLMENASIAGVIGSSGTTTAGIQNVGLNSTDITLYMQGNSAAFAYVKINDPTNITNYQLNLGSSSGNYYYKTVTSQNNGAALVAGWNLLRFDLANLSKVGSPDMTKITYSAFFMNKNGAKINESGYKFDSIVLRRGAIYNVRYYSRFGWQDSSGNYKENSTSDSDVLVADSTEFNLMVHMGKMRAMEELKEWDVVKQLGLQWDGANGDGSGKGGMKRAYMDENPSQSIVWTDEYYSYADNRNDYSRDNNVRENVIL